MERKYVSAQTTKAQKKNGHNPKTNNKSTNLGTILSNDCGSELDSPHITTLTAEALVRPLDLFPSSAITPRTWRRIAPISSAIDAWLGAVVSLLPTKEGCRTQVLSGRWHHIWCSAPLNLDGIPEKTVSTILSTHHGPVRRISVSIDPLPYHYDGRTGRKILDDDACDARVDGWFRSRGIAYLEELWLVYKHHSSGNDVIPPSVFRHAPALHVATFSSCRLPPNLVVDFPLLQQLTLCKVILTEEALNAVLSGCPALESLLLDSNVGSAIIRINSPALRSIGFSAPWDNRVDSYPGIVRVQELVIEDTPCLERLLPLNPHNGPAAIRKMIAVSLTTTMCTVKLLALDCSGLDFHAVLDFLKCFPCLEIFWTNGSLSKS
ncbi:F-box/FBD/LRR-repeat protein At2g26030-like [Aegilops tauschii subsp. strangulata]|uniref:F-box/FBD/LRR-repeat protein At2g26030-like n=1 Tax=Aegilops tauschii subsp. strangulata TaxID=200361 RepID=UPI003CC8CC72